jgi:hypothetical protein
VQNCPQHRPLDKHSFKLVNFILPRGLNDRLFVSLLEDYGAVLYVPGIDG